MQYYIPFVHRVHLCKVCVLIRSRLVELLMLDPALLQRS